MPKQREDMSGRSNQRPRKQPGQKPTSREAKAIRRQLLRWYDLHRRDLPWRKTANAYRIWISEVMLQQTRVQTVIPYYAEFLRRFPDVRRLAKGSERELLACWSGLGYYPRARNLREAARLIVKEHGGRFPRDWEAALALPGVGNYTAAAVLSIAYGSALPVVDGNAVRVLSRVFAVGEDPKSATGSKEILRIAANLLSARRPGDFNQAVMELGATICHPRKPECRRCPIRSNCCAHLRDEVARYPLRRPKRAAVLRRYVTAVARDKDGRVLLVRRPSNHKPLGGFWELPMWERGEEAPSPGLVLERHLGNVRHTITGTRLEIAAYRASVRGKVRGSKWLPVPQLSRFPVTTVSRKALALGYSF
jgi:A/G-specific adenine glycosylase